MNNKTYELADRYGTLSWHILDNIKKPALKMFRERGYSFTGSCDSFTGHVKSTGEKFWVDLLLFNDTSAIIVEVKVSCTRKDIDHFIEQIQPFKQVCPEYADKEILLAVAAVNYERGADNYAHEQGLFVIRVFNDNIFALDSSDGDILRTL